MVTNEQLIRNFYIAFQNKDIASMQSCYDDDAVFTDPVFQNLNATEVRAMWEMLIKKGKDLRIEYTNISSAGHTVYANWVAYYTFSATGNSVVNRVRATFLIQDGRIVKHHDDFDFYHWAKQALGVSGFLFGWTPFLKNKVRIQAMKNLSDYQNRK